MSKRLQAGDAIAVHVTLKDGRALDLQTKVEDPRPRVTILSKSVQLDPAGPPATVRLENDGELPQDARLNFFLKTLVPENFAPAEKIEVATADESFSVMLSEKDGNLTPQDSKTIFGVLDPMKLLGPSAFGPLKFRPVDAEGTDGDWQPLVTLVRIPVLEGVRCAKAAEKQCTLDGDKLFLIDAVSSNPRLHQLRNRSGWLCPIRAQNSTARRQDSLPQASRRPFYRGYGECAGRKHAGMK